MRFVYLVPDLTDPAVERRVGMLRRGGAEVVLAGFHRSADPPATVDGIRPVPLGRTHDARLVHRAVSVLKAGANLRRISGLLGAPIDAILARNLEMLFLAERLRAQILHQPSVAYEILDVHRLLLATQPHGHYLRRLEAKLMAQVGLLIVSSPAFLRDYYRRFHTVTPPAILVENKILHGHLRRQPAERQAKAGPPWRVGVFGALRDARSLELLRTLADRMAGSVEIVIRGKPSPAIFDDLAAAVQHWPHCAYHGPYRNPDDLPGVYSDIHFTWAIDLYEAGGNSELLLPNRLYECGVFGAVPIARSGTETGRFLRDRGYGILLGDDLNAELTRFFASLDADRFRRDAERMARQPATTFVTTPAECRTLVHQIAGLGHDRRVAA